MIEGTAETSRNPEDVDRVGPRIAERNDGPDSVEDFVRFAHQALGMLVRVKPTKILALDRVGEHEDVPRNSGRMP